MKFKIHCLLFMCCCLLVGCASYIQDNTPDKILQNGSDTYTLEMTMAKSNINAKPQTYHARVVIDGKAHDMKKLDNLRFSYDYRRPAKIHKVNYYYEVDCRDLLNRKSFTKTIKSRLNSLTIVNRYVIGLESDRGFPGATINLLGRGFDINDRVDIGGKVCKTNFISKNSLSFVIPLMDKPGTYRATLLSDNGHIGLGKFIIDPGTLRTSEQCIDLSVDEKKIFIVSREHMIDDPLVIDVTTNIPNSIGMRDLIIPAGATSVAAVIQGLEPGVGMLYLSSPGFDEVRIPLEVIVSRSDVVECDNTGDGLPDVTSGEQDSDETSSDQTNS